MFDEIVVPVDGSGFGERALPIALGIACRSGGKVRLVTVIIPLAAPPPHGGRKRSGSGASRCCPGARPGLPGRSSGAGIPRRV
ncbi:universal stress protein [Gemmatimonadota bacterium]